jgi:hypothetical protein
MAWLTPRVLAVVFAAYLGVVNAGAWTFASGLTGPWYDDEGSRWAYATYAVASAVFLVGLANLSYRIARSLDRAMQETEALIESRNGGRTDEALMRRREGIRLRQEHLGRILLGPAAASALILGVSAALLPGTGSFLQRNYQLNAALILGFAYSWPGIGAYVAVAMYALTGALRAERKRRLPAPAAARVPVVRVTASERSSGEALNRALEDLSALEPIGAQSRP